jgi:hypothetical protein
MRRFFMTSLSSATFIWRAFQISRPLTPAPDGIGGTAFHSKQQQI